MITKKKPVVTIVIPTFNSESFLDLVLQSIMKQTYPAKLIQVLLIDGGSSDNTIKIAKKYKVEIIKNKRQHQVYAKQKGHICAKGQYVLHLDSDEVLENPRSIELKVKLFKSDKCVKAVVTSGHKTPMGVSGANYFINDFGDPFSFYMYGFSFNSKFFINQLKNTFKIVYEDKNLVVIDFEKSKFLPGIEMSASGMMIDKEYIDSTFPEVKKNAFLISQVFYYLVERDNYVGFVKNDPVLHFSVSSWDKYLKKLRSRVLNNVFRTEMGKSAFTGRGKYYSWGFSLKKYLFVPYSFSFILPFAMGVTLSISRRTPVFLIYPYLCLYISCLTMYYMVEKALGVKPEIGGYGF